MNFDKLYQQIILDYASRKDLKREIEDPTHVERGHNPSCGDDISLVIRLKNEIIEDISFLGNACAISTASTAMLVELVKGKSISEAKNIVNTFFSMMKNEEVDEKDLELLNEAKILEITKNMPARIKCATLSWHNLKIILEK